MTTINVKGAIIDAENAWFYDWLGIPCTTAAQFKAQLEAATDDVVVEINSPGGYVSEASEIYDAIRCYPGNIECRVVGEAASAASIIACAAPSSISPMGTLFLHNCLSAASGNHNDMRRAMETLESVDENIVEAYRSKTGLSESEIYGLMEENTTLSAKRAVELGFIDRITESAAEAARATGIVAGIAAGAPGFVDPMAIDAERLAAMRQAYEQSKHGITGGGEEAMQIEDMEEAGTVDDVTEPTDADAATEPETGDEPTADATEPETGDEPTADEPGDAPEADATEPVEDGAVSDYDAGVIAERERIAAILDIAPNVPDAMVRAALFENPISAEQLALAAVRADAQSRAGYMEKARKDAQESGSSQVAANVAEADETDDVMALAEKVKQRFAN